MSSLKAHSFFSVRAVEPLALAAAALAAQCAAIALRLLHKATTTMTHHHHLVLGKIFTGKRSGGALQAAAAVTALAPTRAPRLAGFSSCSCTRKSALQWLRKKKKGESGPSQRSNNVTQAARAQAEQPPAPLSPDPPLPQGTQPPAPPLLRCIKGVKASWKRVLWGACLLLACWAAMRPSCSLQGTQEGSCPCASSALPATVASWLRGPFLPLASSAEATLALLSSSIIMRSALAGCSSPAAAALPTCTRVHFLASTGRPHLSLKAQAQLLQGAAREA